MVLRLLSKARHFMVVGVVLVSSIYPTQSHPLPMASLHSKDTTGNWPGSSHATPRYLNPNLQGPSCELLNPDNPNLFIPPLRPSSRHPRGGSSFCHHYLFAHYSHFAFSILQYILPTVRPPFTAMRIHLCYLLQ